MEHCTLCDQESDEIEHLNLYVVGSEGIKVCLNCRIILTNVARSIKQTAATCYLAGYKAAKKGK